MSAERRLPLTATVAALVDAIDDVQRGARTNLADPGRLADEVLFQFARVVAAAEALDLPPSELHPSATFWLTDSRDGQGTHTIVSLSGSGFWVRRGSPGGGTSPGRVHMALPRHPGFRR